MNAIYGGFGGSGQSDPPDPRKGRMALALQKFNGLGFGWLFPRGRVGTEGWWGRDLAAVSLGLLSFGFFEALGALKSEADARDFSLQSRFQPAVLKDQSANSETKAAPKVIAYCVVPGAEDRFVITSDAQLVQVSRSGETMVVGVVVASTSSEYLCLIRTAKLIIGVTGTGHLVNTETGAVVGAVVVLDQE